MYIDAIKHSHTLDVVAIGVVGINQFIYSRGDVVVVGVLVGLFVLVVAGNAVLVVVVGAFLGTGEQEAPVRRL